MTDTGKIFAGRRYYVCGLGRSGLPVAQRLAEYGAKVSAWDDAPEAKRAAQDAGVRVRQIEPPYDALILSPGIPHRFPAPHPVAAQAAAANIPILCDAELLYEAVRLSGSRARFIGITGTNGKSTTTALVAHMLAAAGVAVAAGGNLGTPALALPLLGDDGIYVLEMSSYMLERLATMRFDAAAVLNISPDHLERHGGMDGYTAAKRAIFDRRPDGATGVIGVDDPWGAALAEQIIGAVRLTGAGVPHAAPALPGAHNAMNIAAAIALTRPFVADDGQTIASIATFPGLPHRQQRVAGTGGRLWINDSKATNADSTARALACYEDVIWIAGGIAKAGGIEALARFFSRVKYALLIGRDAPLFASTLHAHGVPHRIVGTLDAAVAAANTMDATVLLSPACASFDQFENFEARGEKFIELVRGLA